MKMAVDGGTLIIKDADNVQFTVIKSWNTMKCETLRGTADLELLDKLSGIVRLPPAAESRRQRLRAVQDAVDRERINPEPVPFFKYPVKMPLYAHQVRGANMAMLTFGWAQPGEGAAGP